MHGFVEREFAPVWRGRFPRLTRKAATGARQNHDPPPQVERGCDVDVRRYCGRAIVAAASAFETIAYTYDARGRVVQGGTGYVSFAVPPTAGCNWSNAYLNIATVSGRANYDLLLSQPVSAVLIAKVINPERLSMTKFCPAFVMAAILSSSAVAQTSSCRTDVPACQGCTTFGPAKIDRCTSLRGQTRTDFCQHAGDTQRVLIHSGDQYCTTSGGNAAPDQCDLHLITVAEPQ